MMSCTGRSGFPRIRSSRPGSCSSRFGLCRSRSAAQRPVSKSWDQIGVSPRQPLGRRAGGGQLPDNRSRAYSMMDLLWTARNCQSLASEICEYLAAMASSLQPAVLSAGFRPEIVCRRESQLGMWTPLVTCPTGTSPAGHCGKSGSNKCAADFSVQAAHAVDRPAAPNCQISHVETL